MRRLLPLAVTLLAAGCSPPEPAAGIFSTVDINAKVETDPVASTYDAADDPAIWRNNADPERSLIIGTDKRAGIHVYDLDGQQISFTPSPRLNNVDLRDNVMINGEKAVLVAASDRKDQGNAGVVIFRLDTAARKLVPLATLPVGKGEAYGMCLWQRLSDGAIFGFVVLKDGRIDQIAFDLGSAIPKAKVVRSMQLSLQAEGCVVDDRTGILYVAEEDIGIWQFDADPQVSGEARSFAKVGGKILVADVEGLALAAADDKGGFLIASSQGDSAFSLFVLPGGKFAGRFRIGEGGSIDGASETDGIELALGDFGPKFRGGLFVVQDGNNGTEPQNFKYSAWQEILTAVQPQKEKLRQ